VALVSLFVTVVAVIYHQQGQRKCHQFLDT